MSSHKTATRVALALLASASGTPACGGSGALRSSHEGNADASFSSSSSGGGAPVSDAAARSVDGSESDGPIEDAGTGCSGTVSCGDAGVPCTWAQAVPYACSTEQTPHGPYAVTCYAFSCGGGHKAIDCGATDYAGAFYYGPSGVLVAVVTNEPNRTTCDGPNGFKPPSCEPMAACMTGDP